MFNGMTHSYTRDEDAATDKRLFTPGVVMLLALIAVLAVAAVVLASRRESSESAMDSGGGEVVGEVSEGDPEPEAAERGPSGDAPPQ
jgi:hypothetical protein